MWAYDRVRPRPYLRVSITLTQPRHTPSLPHRTYPNYFTHNRHTHLLGKLIIWDTVKGTRACKVPLRSSWIMSCCFEEQHNTIVATGGLENVCALYRAEAADAAAMHLSHPIVEFEGHTGYLSCCRFIDSQKVITSSGDATCR